MLAELAADRVHCAIIVFGDSERAREVASRADVRAQGHPFRRVVLVPKPAVLNGEPTFSPLLAFVAQGVDAVAVTIDFRISSTLSGPMAVDFLALEQAFADALAGTVAA